MPGTTADPRRRANSIAAAIIIIGGLVLLVMWTLAAQSIVAARQAAMERTRVEGRNLALAFAEEARQLLADIAHAGDLLTPQIRHAHGQFDLNAWARETPLPWGTVQATLIDPKGKVVSSTVEPNPESVDLSDREHFRIHLNGNYHGLFIGKPVFGRLWRQPLIPITRRIDGEDGNLLGVLVFPIDPGSLTRLHKLVDLGPRDVIALEGLDNVIRARFTRDSPEGTKGIGLSVAGGPRPSTIPENGEGWHIRTSIVDGLPRLYSYRRIGSYPLVVTVGLDLDAALAPARRDAFTIVCMAAVATLLLVLLGFYLIRQNRLRAAHEIELGEERRKLQATNLELGQSKDRAEAASRAKSTFLANMSHELRTPLNAILGFSEMLIGNHGGILRPKQRDYIESIHQSGSHLLTVINDILDLAKIEAGRFELRRIDRLSPEKLARECVELLYERAAARRLALALDLEGPVPPISADAGRIKQILLNLLDNAVKFSPPGETVRLTVRAEDANTVAFIVADNGPGMSADEILLARQPFSQVDNRLARSHEGSGLGLPLAERLAEVHGGSLQIDSEKGHGTRVIVRLPQARAIQAASPRFETAIADGG
ncbi:MAG: hypothetical protein JO058_10075 [Alphaproteobacteria bacterium]|nr:hypothetical protein [Alphaproteobacteria bacterium]